jgi:hypothetical protein
MDALARIESGNKNIHSGVDPDPPGYPGGNSQGYFQINTPTWQDFAKRAGVDLSKYPNAMSAPRDVQAEVASMIPFSRFGPRTRRMLMAEFGPMDTHERIGALAATHGTRPPAPTGAPPLAGASDPSPGPSHLRGSEPHSAHGMSTTGGMSPSGGPWIVGRDGKRYATDKDGAVDYHVAPTSQGADKSVPLSWLGASENAARLMASDWGGDTIHHHYNYDSSDNSTHHNERYSVTINGSNDPQETAAAVGSTLEKSFSKSQARQVFNQGAIA